MADRSSIPWEAYGEAIMGALFGAPSKEHSKPNNKRWGDGGALSLDVRKGVWYNHKDQKGGGLVDLLRQEKGAGWQDWLAAQPFVSSTDRKALERRPKGKANGHASHYPDDYGGGGEPLSPAEDLHAHTEPSGAGVIGEDGKPLTAKRRMTKAYDYAAPNGTRIYQVCRFEWLKENGRKTKTFRQRQQDENGRWIDNIEGIAHQLYRLPELVEARPGVDRIYLAEGEKDVDRLCEAGLIATTNSGGAANWTSMHAKFLAGHDIVILVDNDPAGRARVRKVGVDLRRNGAKSVRALDISEHWPEAGDKADVSDWFDEAGGTAVKLEKLAKGLPIWEPPQLETKFGAVSFKDLWKKTDPYKWLIKGVIPAGERIIIYGETQSGKSFLTLDMVMHMARGADYCGRKTRQVGVAYCAFEGGKGFRGRAMATAKAHGLQHDDAIPFAIFTKPADLFSNPKLVVELINEIREWCAEFSVELGFIVLDTVSAATPGMNENDGAEMGKFLQSCRLMQDAFGSLCSIALVHHKGKMGESPRGSGKLTADLETAIEVAFDESGAVDEQKRPLRVAILRKQREGASGAQWPFILKNYDLGKDEDGDDENTCVVEILDKRALAHVRETETGVRLGDPDTMMMRCLQMAIHRHGEPVPAEVDPGRPTGVTTARWYETARDEEIAISGDILSNLSEADEIKRIGADKKGRQRIASRLVTAEFVVMRAIVGKNSWVWRTSKKVRGVDKPERRLVTPDQATVADGVNPALTAEDLNTF